MLNSKMNSRIFSIVFIFAFFVSAFCITAKAETISFDAENNSITVNIKPDDKPLENVKLKLYKISDGKDSGSYTVTEKFRSYSPEFNFLDSSSYDSYISTLEGFISADSIKPDYELETDSEGKAVFTGLSFGAYLLTGDEYSDETMIVTPSSTLVFLPFKDGNEEISAQAVIDLKYSIKKIDSEKEQLSVYKVWKDNNDSARPKEISVSLYQDGTLYDTVTLNDANNWRHKWDDLEAGKKWTVAENNVPSGYTVAVSRTDNEFVVTNTKEPTTTVTTTTPGTKLPQTGLLWWPIALFSAVGILLVLFGIIIYKKKNEKK